MKNILLAISIFVFLSGANAQQKTSATKSPKPDIYFENPSYDFGTINEGTSVEMTFKFFNSGKLPCY
jgi:hypothetical protein